MKKVHFVNPEPFFVCFLLLFLIVSGCGTGAVPEVETDSSLSRSLSSGLWSVSYDPAGFTGGTFGLVMTDSVFSSVDSLHFHDFDQADSVVYRRGWYVGGGRILVFSVTAPATTDPAARGRIERILEGASAVPPPGLRRVHLSDRSYAEIDSARTSPNVEPPPVVTHRLVITYDPTNSDSCLVIQDSLRVDFTGSSEKSMVFVFDAGEGMREFVLYPDSNKISLHDFTAVLEMNRLYTGLDGSVSGHARLTSAYLTGKGFYPLSETTQNYIADFVLPDSMYSWTPLSRMSENSWKSEPGGITGGLPIALGSYSTTTTSSGYTVSVMAGGVPDSVDRSVIETISGVLTRTLDFSSARFAFIEIKNPDGNIVLPVFGGLLFSRGALTPLSDVSDWDERLSRGEVPDGSDILTGVASGILMQSLKIDPVFEEMLVSWFPLRYFALAGNNSEGVVTLREGYMKYYLFNTETSALRGGPSAVTEYSISDPALADSPLRHFIAGGKGVILLEYMDSRGLLANLPALLQDFTHSFSSNYWPRIYSTLLYSNNLRNQYQELLTKLFYLPGVPQIQVQWREDKHVIYLNANEIQPGIPFSLPMDGIHCMVHLPDTSFTRTVSLVNGVLQCALNLPPGKTGSVRAIDLNPEWLIPADFIYTREEN